MTRACEKAFEPRPWSVPLVRHLAMIVGLKLAFLFALWFLFFRVPDGAVEPGSDIHQHIAGPPGTAETQQRNEVRP